MTEKKVKPTTKKVAKETAVKKTATAMAEPKKTKAVVVKKTPEIKIPEKKILAKKTLATKAKPATPDMTVIKPTPEERYRMVETAAYFIAERHGFQGRSDEHWAEAERQIAAKLGQ